MEACESEVFGGPITLAMNDLVVTKGTPEEAFPPLHKIYSTAPDWFAVGAYTQLAITLSSSVTRVKSRGMSGKVTRVKFVARYLLRGVGPAEHGETGILFVGKAYFHACTQGRNLEDSEQGNFMSERVTLSSRGALI